MWYSIEPTDQDISKAVVLDILPKILVKLLVAIIVKHFLIKQKKKKTVQNTSEKRDNFIGNKSADKTFRKPKPQPGEISVEMPEELWDNKLLINLDRYNI